MKIILSFLFVLIFEIFSSINPTVARALVSGGDPCPCGYQEIIDPWGTGYQLECAPCPDVPIVCFLPGTVVSDASGGKKIEDIVVGDEVTSFDSSDKVVNSSVSKIYKTQKDYYFDLKAGEYEVKGTAEHPFYRGSGIFSELQTLKPGDVIYVLKDAELVEHVIISNTRVDEKTEVYNMTVDNTHTYFADGFAVHNKSGGGGYVYPSCGAGTSLSCNNSTSFCVESWKTCGPYFPSSYDMYTTSCPHWPNDTLAYNPICITSCNCCAPGELNVCEAGTYSYTYWGGSRVNNRGETVADDPKLCASVEDAFVSSSRTALPCNRDDNDELIGCQYTSSCRRCGCEPVCSAISPTAPDLTSPGNGTPVSGVSASLQWRGVNFGISCPGPNAPNYSVYFGTTATPPLAYPNIGNITTKTVTIAPGNTYYWYIQATNGTQTANSPTWQFTAPLTTGSITGKVYLDTNNVCSPATPFSGRTVVLDGVTSATTNASGDFTFPNALLASSHTLSATIPAGYTCSTAAGCNSCSRTGVPGSDSTTKFYLTSSREAWWQAVGAGVYAGSTGAGLSATVRSQLPYPTSQMIIPGTVGDVGAVVRASGTVDDGSGTISTPGYTSISKYSGPTMSYAYFEKKMGLLSTSPTLLNLNTKPNYVAEDFYLRNGAGTVGDTWTVNSGEKYVIFVNGDLRINQSITVVKGGFLAFIVKGKVTVASNVSTVQGLYVMDGNFITESNGLDTDSTLDVQGSIVAWGTLSLARDKGNGNLTGAAETFTYRPDLLVNMPDKMKAFVMQWQEVPAGSF